jgi:hypothetical protein
MNILYQGKAHSTTAPHHISDTIKQQIMSKQAQRQGQGQGQCGYVLQNGMMYFDMCPVCGETPCDWIIYMEMM